MAFNLGDKVRTIRQANSAGSFEGSSVGFVVAGQEVWVNIIGTPYSESSLMQGPLGPKYTWVSFYTDDSETNQQKYPVLVFTAGLELA